MAKFASQEIYTSPLAAGTVPASVVLEIEAARAEGAPFTWIRPLASGTDSLPPPPCAGSAGNYQHDCPNPPEAIQYVMSTGEPLCYCKEHALATNAWDIIHYRSAAKPVLEMTTEQVENIQRLFRSKRRKKAEEFEP